MIPHLMATPTIYGGSTPDAIYHLLVTGDRWWDDYSLVLESIRAVAEWCEEEGYELHVVHGWADGADSQAGEAARELELPCHSYPAPWDRIRRLGLGPAKSAGTRRNTLMRERHEIDGVLAFHDDLWGRSKGTKNMVEQIRKLGIEFKHVHH